MVTSSIEKNSVSHSDQIYRTIDRVLHNKSDSIKTLVYELVIQKDIDPNDEFLLVYIALDQLEVLIEKAPIEWKSIFTEVKVDLKKLLTEYFNHLNKNQEELTAWSNNNLEVLSQIASKVEAMERLAVSSSQLSQSAAELLGVCSDLSTRLGNLTSQESNSLSQLKDYNNKLSTAIENIPKLPKELSTQLKNQLENHIDVLSDKLAVTSQRQKWTWKDSLPIFSILLSLGCMVAVLSSSSNLDYKMNRVGLYLEKMSINQKEERTVSTTTTERPKKVRALLLELYRNCLEDPSVLRECETLVK